MNVVLDRRVKTLIGVLVAVVLFAILAQAIQDTGPWNTDAAALPEGPAQLDPLTEGIFTTHVFAFEVLGVLLTAAMIGALVIARPLGIRADSANYWNDPDTNEAEPEMDSAHAGPSGRITALPGAAGLGGAPAASAFPGASPASPASPNPPTPTEEEE